MPSEDNWQLTALLDYERGRGDPYAAAIRGTAMPMVITDTRQPNHLMVFVNDAFQQMTGYDRSELIGHDCRMLQGPESGADAVQEIRLGLDAGRPVDVDLLNYRKDGSTFWNAIRIAPVRDDSETIRFWVASMLDITDRVEAKQRVVDANVAIEDQVRLRTAELEMALSAKTTLLHELDHRVKNNLAMIGALVRLQLRLASDPSSRLMMSELLARIEALSSVHRRLFQSKDVGHFDLGEFSRTLVSDILATTGRTNVAVENDVELVDIGADRAAAASLVVNELVSNAVKHAFANGRAGTLKLKVHAAGDMAVVSLQDDGSGFDPAARPNDSLGGPLIERLSRQIGGATRWSSTSSGTCVTLEFPISG